MAGLYDLRHKNNAMQHNVIKKARLALFVNSGSFAFYWLINYLLSCRYLITK